MISLNRTEFSEALQHIADSSSEQYLDSVFFGAYLSSDDDDFDTHLANCLETFVFMISYADEEYDSDVSKSVDQFIGIQSLNNSADILHLENCLVIDSKEPIK